ncbi:MAG: GGDEF domain-containing protein [Oscillospiraceae bacterium]
MSNEFKRRMCEMEFDRYNYDFIYSDAATFAFLKYRFYVSFDSMLLGNSKQVLEQYVNEEKYRETFLIDIEDGDGKPVTMACQILPPIFSDAIRLRMIELEELVDVCENAALDKRINNDLTRQYSDLIYSYNAHTREIALWRDSIEENVLCTVPIDEFEEKMSRKLKDVSREDFAKFVSNIRTGVRAFSTRVECIAEDKKLTLTGLAAYENIVHEKTVGRFGPSCVSTSLLDLLDPLTGVYTKERITDYAKQRINERHQRTAIAIVDLDDFKQVNDNFGHSKGDEVLRRISDILIQSVGNMGKVGRIGGDEFFVVYDDFENIQQVRFTMMGMRSLATTAYSEEKDGFSTSLSVGCSVYPDDYNGTFEEMFKLADAFLYRAKDKGKNRYIVYNEEKHGPAKDIIKYGFKKSGFDKSELVCKLMNSIVCGERLDVDDVLESVARYFSIERIVLYDKTNRCIKSQYGQKHLTLELIRRTIGYIYDEGLTREYVNGFFTTNNSEYFAGRAPEVFKKLMEQSNFAFQHFVVHGKSGKEYVLSLDAVNAHTTWNLGDVQYYRIIVKLLEQLL